VHFNQNSLFLLQEKNYISLFYFMGVSGVKLAYCYSIITIGMFFFCLLNGKTITKMILDRKSSS